MPRRQNPPERPLTPIEFTVGGKTYNGSYRVTSRLITVSFGGETKTTQLGSSNPEILARALILELARKPM